MSQLKKISCLASSPQKIQEWYRGKDALNSCKREPLPCCPFQVYFITLMYDEGEKGGLEEERTKQKQC